MRSSAEIWSSIQSLEQEKAQLKELSGLFNSIGDSLFDYSEQLIGLSDLLFEGYNIDNEMEDIELRNESESYKEYASLFEELSNELNNEISNIEDKIISEKAAYEAAVNREKMTAESKKDSKTSNYDVAVSRERARSKQNAILGIG